MRKETHTYHSEGPPEESLRLFSRKELGILR